MTALLEVAAYLPPQRVDVASYLAAYDLADDAGWYERYYGFARIRQDPQRTLVDQLCAAAADLHALPGRARDVRYVVYAPTIQVAGGHHGSVLPEVCRRLGLDHACAFSLSQHACATALLGVDVCGRLLAADRVPRGLGLVLTGEKTFTRVARLIPHSAVMGEGTAAVLVCADGARDRMLSYASRTLGTYHEAPFQSPAKDEAFQRAYPQALAAVIRQAVAEAGLVPDDLALVLPHHVNRMSWLRVARELGIGRHRLLLDNQPEYGHCFGADPFVNYRTALAAGHLRPGDHYVMASAGLGATLAAVVFRH